MPKENVKDAGFDDRRLEVKWEPHCFVQVGATSNVVHEPTETTSGFTTWEGEWVDLDRAGINRLIRMLRKARDAAYGADA